MEIQWHIREHRDVPKAVPRLPPWIVKEYEAWKNLVVPHGPQILRQYPGYHDEQLKGRRLGQRSSRLSRQYRVIYAVNHQVRTVYVLELTPHRY